MLVELHVVDLSLKMLQHQHVEHQSQRRSQQLAVEALAELPSKEVWVEDL